MHLKKGRTLKILDFDLENRPLSYLGQDFTTSDITAIAWSWVEETKVECWALGEVVTEIMLEQFVEVYNESDMVTGHYIRKHDLPIINGALMEFGKKPLTSKLSSDTKLDLLKRSGISASQESLADMLNVQESKYHMSQTKWRRANRLEREGVELTRKRAMDDVRQHKALRKKLIEAGMLGPPRVWSP